MTIGKLSIKIKCPSCDNLYRTHDAILTHLGQTGCLEKKKITKKLLNTIDYELKEKLIRNRLKAIKHDIDHFSFAVKDLMEKDEGRNSSFYNDRVSDAKNNFRILNGILINMLQTENVKSHSSAC